MAKVTLISWAGATHPFWKGCEKVSQGCKFCYAERLIQTKMGLRFRDVIRAPDHIFPEPLNWTPRTIFPCSLSDFFLPAADQWRDLAWKVIRETPFHDWLILTKRIERVPEHLPEDWGEGWPHVWIGTSTEDQDAADKRIPSLLDVPVYQNQRFISAEPLLGGIDLSRFLETGLLSWVITGGESGFRIGEYRPMDHDWVLSIHSQIEQVNEFGIPVVHFHKQNGGAVKRDGEWGGYKVGPNRETFRDLPDFPSMRKGNPPETIQLTLF